MSKQNARVPAFGISRSGHNNNGSTGYTDIRPTANFIESSFKIPVLSLESHTSGQGGDIVLNRIDNLLYYHTGQNWVPLAIMDIETRQKTDILSKLLSIDNQRNVIIQAPYSGNIHLIAGNHPNIGSGGHLHLTAGQGGVSDGKIYVETGGDTVLTVDSTGDVIVNTGNLQVTVGDVVMASGNVEFEAASSGINYNIETREVIVEADEDSSSGEEADDYVHEEGEVKDLTMNSTSGIIDMSTEANFVSISGKVCNSLISKNTMVMITPVGSGYLNATVTKIDNGFFEYSITNKKYSIKQCRLQFIIHNSI